MQVCTIEFGQDEGAGNRPRPHSFPRSLAFGFAYPGADDAGDDFGCFTKECFEVAFAFYR